MGYAHARMTKAKGRRRNDGTPTHYPLDPRTKVIFTRVTPELHARAAEHARRRGIGIADLTRLALRDWIETRPELPLAGPEPRPDGPPKMNYARPVEAWFRAG